MVPAFPVLPDNDFSDFSTFVYEETLKEFEDTPSSDEDSQATTKVLGEDRDADCTESYAVEDVVSEPDDDLTVGELEMRASCKTFPGGVGCEKNANNDKEQGRLCGNSAKAGPVEDKAVTAVVASSPRKRLDFESLSEREAAYEATADSPEDDRRSNPWALEEEKRMRATIESWVHESSDGLLVL